MLSATEFWDFLCSSYNFFPLKIQSQCDGCVTYFGVTHELSCSTDGLIIMRRNGIHDKLLYLSWRTLTPASVGPVPLIYQYHPRSEQEILQGSDKEKEIWGDVMIWGLWASPMSNLTTLLRIHTNIYQLQHSWPSGKLSRRTRTVSTVTTNRNNFRYFSFSTCDAREGRPVCTSTIELSHDIKKGRTPFASIGWITSHITIAVTRSYSRIIHRSQIPIPLWEREPDWDTESGIGLEG